MISYVRSSFHANSRLGRFNFCVLAPLGVSVISVTNNALTAKVIPVENPSWPLFYEVFISNGNYQRLSCFTPLNGGSCSIEKLTPATKYSIEAITCPKEGKRDDCSRESVTTYTWTLPTCKIFKFFVLFYFIDYW